MDRTDEQKMFQEPTIVILGGREHEVKPLVILYSRPWRKKVIGLISTLPKYAKVDTSKPDEFSEAINVLMVESQNAIIDLFFDYAKDLPREEIEAEATEAELAVAFEGVLGMAFPLSETLPQMMTPPKSQSAKG